MGDTGSMLLGLLLAYGPISSTASLDQNLLVKYGQLHPFNRFPTILPLIIPVAIWLIPYTDMVLAVIRRTMKGMSPFDADRQHLHHRLQNMGHSHRQTVLLMYLWAALFTGLVVGLSVLRIPLIWFAVITLGAIGALVLATAPKLRPWHSTGGGKRERPRGSRIRSDDPLSATTDLAAPVGGPVPGLAPPASLSAGNGASPAGRSPNGTRPASAGPASAGPVSQAPAAAPPGDRGRGAGAARRAAALDPPPLTKVSSPERLVAPLLPHNRPHRGRPRDL
jgi:UDP-GlcNAc:undecaprenyl-phosphate GlcNAc-1-phosphate transferase